MTPAAVFEALARSFGDLCAAVGGDGLVTGQAPGLRYGALGGPIPDINRLMPTAMIAARADADIAASLRALDRFPLLSAWIPPDAAPADLAARFHGHGFRADGDGGVPAMSMRLDSLPGSETLSGVEIVQVRRRSELETANLVLAEGFGAPAELAALFTEIIGAAVLTRRGPLRQFLATLHGRPVATAVGHVTGDLVGIYSVATVPDARGGGLGRAVTLAAMRDGATAGARHAILESSSMGLPVYSRLGFVEAGRYEVLIRRREDVV